MTINWKSNLYTPTMHCALEAGSNGASRELHSFVFFLAPLWLLFSRQGG